MKWLIMTAVIVAASAVEAAPTTTKPATETVKSVCPGLARGVLTEARVADLPKGVCVQAGTVQVTQVELDKEIAGAPPGMQEQLRKNAFFLAEARATRLLLLVEAKRHAPPTRGDSKPSDALLINTYLRTVAEKAAVPEAEVKTFYERNKRLFGEAALKDVKASIEAYLLEEKQQAAVNAHIRAMGTRLAILVDRAWAKAQLALARDNPVDKARWSGKGPTVVVFGAAGCCGPDLTQPLMAAVAEELKDKAQVVYIDAREQAILAGRYGVQSVPTFIFFNDQGKEAARRSGLLEPEEIVKLVKDEGSRRGRSRG